jgi:hypothetical protein
LRFSWFLQKYRILPLLSRNPYERRPISRSSAIICEIVKLPPKSKIL